MISSEGYENLQMKQTGMKRIMDYELNAACGIGTIGLPICIGKGFSIQGENSSEIWRI